MSDIMITLTLPEDTYRRLKRAAELTRRSLDEVLLTTINASLPAPEDLPPELADELAAMHLLSDGALWTAVQPSLSPAEEHRLKSLNQLAGERSLTQAEKAEQETLLNAYYRSLLRRSQALAILAQRGHPIQPEELAPVSKLE